MAKNKIVDSVADAVVQAEVAIVKAGRQAVAAIQRTVDAGAARVVSKKKAARKAVKKAVKKAAAKTRKAAVKAKAKVRQVVKKAAKRKHR
jgi:hypothetical protein